MKKLLVVVAAAAAVLLISCGSTPKSDLKGAGAEMKAGKAQIMDYKGSDVGADIPAWVTEAAAGGNQKIVKKALGLEEDDKIWVVSARGKTLSFLREWTDQMDARSQIASGIEQTIGDAVKGVYGGSSDGENEEADVKQALDRAGIRMTDITLEGLEKYTDYWTYARLKKPEVKKVTSDADYNYFYNYYVVYTMKESVWQKQLKSAMKDMPDNDEKSSALRDSVEALLNEHLKVPAKQANDTNAVADVPEDVEYDFE